MIIELEINGARVIISGDNLTVNLTQDDQAKSNVLMPRIVQPKTPTAETIKELRKKLKLTQCGFARMLRVNQATISRWETGADEPHGAAAVLLANMITDAGSSSGAVGLIALREWIKAGHGRQSSLAEALGITTPAIPQWQEVPADKLVLVEKITGISRQVLRPDLFDGMRA